MNDVEYEGGNAIMIHSESSIANIFVIEIAEVLKRHGITLSGEIENELFQVLVDKIFFYID